MQTSPFPFLASVFSQILLNSDLSEEIGSRGSSLFFSIALSQESDMDLSKVGEKILNSVRSARSLHLFPLTSDRPEVPARATAAAAVARALADFPPNQRLSLPSCSEELCSIYGIRTHDPVVKELEECFYIEKFDPVSHVLEHIPLGEDELTYFEGQATVKLAQLDNITEQLSGHVMEHHEEMVKGMHLIRELEKDLKVANVICMNGRRHLTSSMNEVSRDLIVTSYSKRKQDLMDLLGILLDLHHALCMKVELESNVEEGNYLKAFQVLSEYLQLLDSFSELSVIQEMSSSVEAWLGKTLKQLDALLLSVCHEFKEAGYITVVDAYALIGDISGLAEKIQSFFMQDVLSKTRSVLKNILQEDQDSDTHNNRFNYNDLCLGIPEPKFRHCLLGTLASLFKVLSAYYAIMDFQVQNKVGYLSPCPTMVHSSTTLKENSRTGTSEIEDFHPSENIGRMPGPSGGDKSTSIRTFPDVSEIVGSTYVDSRVSSQLRNTPEEVSSSGSPWFQLRKDATMFISETLYRGRRNLWQLASTRVSVLLSSPAVCVTSIHQFLRNYEDLNIFILAGEAFCGIEALDLKQKLKAVSENYFAAFHRQNIYALKMVLEKESWMKLPPDMLQVISFAGLVGDGAPLFISSTGSRSLHSDKFSSSDENSAKGGGFSHWFNRVNPFLSKLSCYSKDYCNSFPSNGVALSGGSDESYNDLFHNDDFSPRNNDVHYMNGNSSVPEDENDDLLADFIDEDSQLPSRLSKPRFPRNHSSHCSEEEVSLQTGSSLCLLRLMDKYARLMQKLEIVNSEFFKGICQLFEVFFHFLFETFGHHSNNTHNFAKGSADSLNYRLKATLSIITQNCSQWIKPLMVPPSSSSPTSLNFSFQHVDLTTIKAPTSTYNHLSTIGLKERCAGVDTISLVAKILHRSKPHLQSMLLQNNVAMVEDFYVNVVDVVPDLIEHIHKTTARLLLHIDEYVDLIANEKWELKDLGFDHNRYVDLLLGEFKHYKTRLLREGLREKVQDLLLEYGLEIVADTLIEGLSRVKKCTDQGRALMALDLQVLISGLQHFAPSNVRPKFQVVETFIKAYYLPETEYVHWVRGHPEYSKNQLTGLVNLVASMKSWKKKSRMEVLDKI